MLWNLSCTPVFLLGCKKLTWISRIEHATWQQSRTHMQLALLSTAFLFHCIIALLGTSQCNCWTLLSYFHDCSSILESHALLSATAELCSAQLFPWHTLHKLGIQHTACKIRSNLLACTRHWQHTRASSSFSHLSWCSAIAWGYTYYILQMLNTMFFCLLFLLIFFFMFFPFLLFRIFMWLLQVQI